MGFLDQVLGSVVGGASARDGRTMSGSGGSPLIPILMSLLAGRAMGGGGGLGGLLGGLSGGGLGGGLGGLIDQFTRAGHGDVAQSWVDSGPNRPLAPHQLEEVLGTNTVDDLQRQTGMGRGDLLSQLSAHLPEVVDRLTPHGRLPTDDDMRHW